MKWIHFFYTIILYICEVKNSLTGFFFFNFQQILSVHHNSISTFDLGLFGNRICFSLLNASVLQTVFRSMPVVNSNHQEHIVVYRMVAFTAKKFILDSKWIFVPNVKKCPHNVPDIASGHGCPWCKENSKSFILIISVFALTQSCRQSLIFLNINFIKLCQSENL